MATERVQNEVGGSGQTRSLLFNTVSILLGLP